MENNNSYETRIYTIESSEGIAELFTPTDVKLGQNFLKLKKEGLLKCLGICCGGHPINNSFHIYRNNQGVTIKIENNNSSPIIIEGYNNEIEMALPTIKQLIGGRDLRRLT